MNILVIAPLPPPINGQSLAADTIYRVLNSLHNVKTVNMAKLRPKSFVDKVRRYFEVVSFLIQVIVKQYNCELIYLTISESVAGNIKDICIYLICYNKLKSTFVHMLGGAGMKRILAKQGILFRLNKFFINRMRGVIVEGQAQADTFSQLISRDRIHVVPNFAEDFLFVNEDEVRKKFTDTEPLQILFLSNLLYGKGHNELADAYLALNEEIKRKVKIVFVGGFESDGHKSAFFEKIANNENLTYYGNFVSGNDKRVLYCKSHVFCLPTYYPYEGQPISILEAYATGCVVITTYHSGIPEVFRDNVNGFVVDKQSVNSLKLAIERCVANKTELLDTAIFNRNAAYTKYRTEVYCSSLLNILGVKNNASSVPTHTGSAVV